ncbi:MAG: UbiX family flavin prenyltransferase, partial [Pseudomonadales bacterium]|nr:UbiX family flavin prenyltransferase [Pseudomonadales bacterium]
MRLIIGISGASGVIYGIRMLEMLKQQSDVETHLVISATGKMNIPIETEWSVKDVSALADCVHKVTDVGATIASGSFKTDGMIIAPCSIKTLSGIVNSYADNLLTRAADVVLKE